MSTLNARSAVRAVLIFSCLTLSTCFIWAQNENETVGFQSNHVFESGHFGEDIDILNGGLHLTIPIGPRFEVNDRLGYQLALQYNSKVWDYSDYVNSDVSSVKPYNEGPTGIGFTLNFGRLIQDVHWRVCSDGYQCWAHTWKWVTPDGNQHDVWFKEDQSATPNSQFYPLIASDLSYAMLNAPASHGCLPTEDPNCFSVSTPDGLTYTMGQHVAYAPSGNNQYRDDNLSFGGWYVTRIEDRSVTDQSGGYPMSVTIQYDTTRPGFEHLIKKVTDGRGREIIFHNCKYDTVGNCTDTPTTTADTYPNTTPPIYNRHAIATYQIDVPAFWGNEAVPTTQADKDATKAIYALKYAFTPISRTHIAFPGSPASDGPVLELLRLDYPQYPHRGAPSVSDTYSIYFGYVGPPTDAYNRGELNCRTLPLVQPTTGKTCYDWEGTEVVFKYMYSYYAYTSMFFSAGKGVGGVTGKNSGFTAAPDITSASRQVATKTVVAPNTGTYQWSYDRSSSPGYSNPPNVKVTDPFGNDTVYYYRGSVPPISSDPHSGADPEDGIAPEWDDGLNYKIEYYKGTGAQRLLVRSENLEYDADMAQSPVTGLMRHTKTNSRMSSKTTVFHDDAGAQTVVAHSDWDNFGHWRTDSETGFQIQGTRITHTQYLESNQISTYISGLLDYREVHDGYRVLERTDNDYRSSDARLNVSIARKTLPGSVQTPKSVSTMAAGDIKTTYTYNTADGSIHKKTLSRWVGQPGSEVSEYCIGYTWNQGYLKTKTFLTDCAAETSIGWNAIDRKRDGNTGAIFSTKDTTGAFETTYNYDRMGRLTDITPPNGELATAVDYPSLKETTVTRGGGTDYQFSRYLYDGLGRVIREEKRPADPTNGNPYRATCYDIDNRTTFKSEWLAAAISGYKPCDPNLPQNPQFIPGTQYDFGGDPFGRIQKVTTADGSVTTTSYKGLDSTVTVQNVMGVGSTGGAGNVTTSYFRDGWNRLLMVDAPSERRCDMWGAICTKDADCGANHFCKATDGADASYAYDLRDNLIQVDLVDQMTQKKQSRFFEYDGLNHLYTATNPENGPEVYTDYDSLGNVLSVTDASNVTLQSSYDKAGRLLQVNRWPGGTVIADNQYDAVATSKGKLSSSNSYQDDHTLTVNLAYSYAGLNGRLSALTYGLAGWPANPTQQSTFAYDPYGNVSSIVYPPGAAGLGGDLTVSYELSNGIPTKAKDSAGVPLAWVTYAPSGAIATLTTQGDGAGNAQSQISFDSQNRPSSINIGKWSGSAFVGSPYYSSGQYAYDGAGNISAIGVNTYRYDTANRLKEVHETTGSPAVNYVQCFAYDAFGNMFGKVDQVGTGACSSFLQWDDVLSVTAPDGTNRNRVLSQQIPGSGPMNFVYDANGNVLKDWERRYLYDSRNRLTSVGRYSVASDPTSPVTELALYEYGSDGNRVIKRDRLHDLVTFFLRGPDGQVLSEFRRTTSGTYVPEWSQHHVYLAGREVALRENRLPNPPGGLSLTTLRNGSYSNVMLKWRKSPAEDNVTSYNVYRGNTGSMQLIGSSGTACADPNYICYTDLSVTTDSYVQYQVTAVSSIGQSYGSDLAWLQAGDITAPHPATCLNGTAGDGRVSLSWMGSVTDDVLGYNIYRQTAGSGPITKITQLPVVSGTKYVDSGLTNGVTYTYWVRAVDNAGNESVDIVNGGKTCGPTGVTCTTTANCTCPDCDYLCGNVCGHSTSTPFTAMPKDFAPPAPPRNVTVTGACSVGSATVTWGANATTDGVIKYWLYRYPDFSPAGPKPVLAPTTTYADSGLSSSTTYYYWLTAEDGGVNDSAPSQKVGVSERSTSLPVPPGKLRLTAGNGQVLVRFQTPTDVSQIQSFVIYRKLNAEPSCGAYQQVGSVAVNANPLQFTDLSVTNNLAWDYAVVSRNSVGNESGLSESALAIPTSPPLNYRECTLPGSGAGPLLVMKWDPPQGKPYHPLDATNSNGDLSYLQGYHVRRERLNLSNLGDRSHLVEEMIGSTSGSTLCEMTLASCNAASSGSSQCPFWDSCVQMGTCSVTTGQRCVQNSDCPATEVCNRDLSTPTDPYLLQDAGTSFIYWIPPDPHFNNCEMVSSVYKVYASGNWQTVVSQPTANFDPTKLSPDPASASTRCTPSVIDPTSASAPACSTSEPPSIGAPSVSQPLDSNNQPIPGSLHVDWSSQVPADKSHIAGYYLYVTETNGTTRLAPYGFASSQPARPFITLGPTQTSFDFSDLPRDVRGSETVGPITQGGASMRYQFQVAVFDYEGRISSASPLSTPLQLAVSYPAKPMGLKTVVWTVNDANIDGSGLGGTSADPRSFDGIKLQWKSGTWTGIQGFRLYRSNSPDGPFCAIVKSVDPATNPPNTPICVDSTAYSTSLTTSASGSGNKRFFMDNNVTPGVDYYYKVKSIGSPSSSTDETDFSATVTGMVLKHATLPLSPPRHLKAWAPMILSGSNWVGAPGVNLRWCPNPSQENVTGYKIYRSTASGGPYSLIATLGSQSPDTTLTDCLGGSRRCYILPGATGAAPQLNNVHNDVCSTGPAGTCKIVDLGVQFPLQADSPTNQLAKIYYYVVTAVRGTEESAFSVENAGWPNYCTSTCSCSGISCTGSYGERYDHDNLGDMACDDEVSELMAPSEGRAPTTPLEDRSLGAVTSSQGSRARESLVAEGSNSHGTTETLAAAPYRIIGAMIGSGGGVGGAMSPSASPRWLFLHTDHLGSPRAITDNSGNVVSTHHYMPFGDEKPIPTRVSSNNHKFTGHERDPESSSTDNPDGLDYMLARYYSASLGRFVNPDPTSFMDLQDGDEEEREEFQEKISNPQNWNNYAYALNNPIKYTDPDGKEAASAVLGGAIAGAAEGGGAGAVAGAAAGGAVVGAFGIGYVAGTAINQIPGVSDFATNAMAAVIGLATGTSLGMADNTGKTLNQVNGLLGNALAHVDKIATAGGPGKDPDFNHHKNEIKTALKDALKKAQKLTGKLKDKVIQKIKTIAGKVGIKPAEIGLK